MRHEFLAKLRALFRRNAVSGEIRDEMRFHVDMRAGEYEKNGVPADDARRAASRRFGNEAVMHDRGYDVKGASFHEAVVRDIRHAARRLMKDRGFSLVAIATLALAIGANSAIFSAVNAVLLRPLPVEDPGALVVTWLNDPAHADGVIEMTHRHYEDWAAGSVFTSAAAIGSHTWPTVLDGHGEPVKLAVAGVSSTFFDTLGTQPMLGRGLRREDDVHRASSVVVLAHGAWVRLFAADRGVIGRRIQLDGQAAEVVGVMPEGFDFPRGADLWAPVVPILSGPGDAPNLNVLNGVGLLYVVGRLRPDLDARLAAPELNEMSRRLAAAMPAVTRPSDVAVVRPFADHVFGPVQPALWALSAAVVVLLVVACANVSGLMLTRVSLRRREHGVRLALGATRGGLSRLWTVEVLLLASIGGAIGYAASHALVRAIVALAPDDLPRLHDVAIDTSVTIFTFIVVLVAAVLAGAFPVRQTRAVHIVDLLDDGGRATAARRSLRARSALLVGQIGLAVVLLVTCGLIVRSFINLRRVNLGFSPANVLTLTVQPRSINEPPNQWFDRLLSRVAALPGVDAAGAIYLRPLVLGPIGQGVAVRLEGEPQLPPGQSKHPILNHQIATVGYFETMKIRLSRGRLFSRGDTSATDRVVLVGESTARRLWPAEDPIGKRLAMAGFTPGKPGPAWRTVVGVVSDVRYRGLEEVLLDIYDPALQVGRPANQLVVRSSTNPLALAGAIQAEARTMDAQVIVDDVTTMDAVVARATAPWRLTTWMFVLFAGVAFALAAAGLFSLVALEVANRRREFAVRLALGATGGEILQAVVFGAAWRAAIGLAAGLLVAVALTRGVRSLLFEVEAADTTTYVSVAALVIAVVVTAAVIPARRAARVDPAAALRAE